MQRSRHLGSWGTPANTGSVVAGGEYAFASPAGEFIRVKPCHGASLVLEAARARLKNRGQKLLANLVINYDADEFADRQNPTAGDAIHIRVFAMLREFDPAAAALDATRFQIDSGATEAHVAKWSATDGPGPGLPHQQSLERLICAAVLEAYPSRGIPVDAWLKSRPEPPAAHPKEHLFSFLAGWYADAGSYEGLIERLWADAVVSTAILRRLDASGVLAVAKRIAT